MADYVMRAWNTNLSQNVFWESLRKADRVGTSSPYDPADLTNIVVYKSTEGMRSYTDFSSLETKVVNAGQQGQLVTSSYEPIGVWGSNGSVLTQVGPANLGLVTDSRLGKITAVATGTIFSVKYGHGLLVGDSVMVWDTSAATELATARTVTVTNPTSVTVDGADITVAVGDIIYALGVSEFTIGSTGHIRPAAGAEVSFSSGLKVNGTFTMSIGDATVTATSTGNYEGTQRFLLLDEGALSSSYRSVASDDYAREAAQLNPPTVSVPLQDTRREFWREAALLREPTVSLPMQDVTEHYWELAAAHRAPTLSVPFEDLAIPIYSPTGHTLNKQGALTLGVAVSKPLVRVPVEMVIGASPGGFKVGTGGVLLDPGMGDWSCEWVANATDATTNRRMIDCARTSGSTGIYAGTKITTGVLDTLLVDDAGVSVVATGTRDLRTLGHSLFHLIIDRTAGLFKTYVNGKLEASSNITSLGNLSIQDGTFTLGLYYGALSSQHIGGYGNVSVHVGHAFTATEVAERYALLTGSLDEVLDDYVAPVHRWKMNEISGKLFVDSQNPDTFDILTDGDCEHPDMSQWDTNLYADLSKVESSPHSGVRCIRVTAKPSVVTTYPALDVTIPFGYIPGHVYSITGWARGDGTKIPYIYCLGPAVLWTGTSSTAWQYFSTLPFTAPTSVKVQFAFAAVAPVVGTEYCDWDDLTFIDHGPAAILTAAATLGAVTPLGSGVERAVTGNASTQMASVPHASFTTDYETGTFSVVAVARVVTAAAVEPLCGKMTSYAAENAGFGLYVQTNLLRFALCNGTTLVRTDSASVAGWDDGTWFVVVATVSATGVVSLYFRSSAQSVTTVGVTGLTGSRANTNNFLLGRFATSDAGLLGGDLAEVSILNYELSKAQIDRLWERFAKGRVLSSPTGHIVTTTGDPTWEVDGKLIGAQYALDFNTGPYVGIYGGDYSPTTYTVEMIASVDTLADKRLFQIGNDGVDSEISRGLSATIYTGGQIRFVGGASAILTTFSPVFAINTKYHLVFCVDGPGKTITTYRNGTESSLVTLTSVITNSTVPKLTLGARVDGTFNLDGQLSNFSYFPSVLLTAEEILERYKLAACLASPTGHLATSVGNFDLAADFPACGAGLAYSSAYNGATSGYFQVVHSPVDLVGHTVLGIIKVKADPASLNALIYGEGATAGFLLYSSAGSLRFVGQDDTGFRGSVKVIGVTTDDEVYHFAICFDDALGNCRIYQDGVLRWSTVLISANSITVGAIGVASNPSSYNPFNLCKRYRGHPYLNRVISSE